MSKKLLNVFIALVVIFFAGCSLDTFPINRTIQLVSISVDLTDAKTEYVKNETFTSEGIKVIGHYTDGSQKDITDLVSDDCYNLNNKIFEKEETKTVNLEYQNLKCNFNIEVEEKKIVGIKITQYPTKRVYESSGSINIDYTGLIVKELYNNNEYGQENITESLQKAPKVDKDFTTGSYNVELKYNNFTTSFPILILTGAIPENISISLKNEKKIYSLGEKISKDDIVLEFKKDDKLKTLSLNTYFDYMNITDISLIKEPTLCRVSISLNETKKIFYVPVGLGIEKIVIKEDAENAPQIYKVKDKNNKEYAMKKILISFTLFLLTATLVCTGTCYYTENVLMKAMAITFGTISYHFVMRYLVGYLYNRLLDNKVDYRRKWFAVSKIEMKIYQKLKVKKWKKYMPTYDASLFDPRIHSWEEIAQAMCQAELVHETIMICSFLPIFGSIWFGALGVFVATSIGAAMLDGIFVIIQRFNRPRILKIMSV